MEGLRDKAISVEYMCAFIIRVKEDMAYVIFRVADNEGAVRIFTENGFKVMRSNEF